MLHKVVSAVFFYLLVGLPTANAQSKQHAAQSSRPKPNDTAPASTKPPANLTDGAYWVDESGNARSFDTSRGEMPPTFNGDMNSFLQAHTNYPDTAREKGQQGSAYIQLTINPSGDAGNEKIVQSSGFALLDREVLRVIALMHKNYWKPARVGGKTIRSWYIIKVTFSLG